jgi:hypothetical protein
MKSRDPYPSPPADTTLDRLLARGYRDTTPAFEARWTQLKRDLRAAPARPRRAWTWPGLGWLVPLAAAAAVLLWVRPAAPPHDATLAPAALAELWHLDELLGPALALLNDENRAAVLHLPTAPPSL